MRSTRSRGAPERVFGLETRDPEEEISAFAANWESVSSPIARSVAGFSPATARNDAFLPNDFRRVSPRFQGENFQKNLLLVERIEGWAREKGCTPAQPVLACSRRAEIRLIPGTKRRTHLDENLRALEASSRQPNPERMNKMWPFKGGVAAGARYPEAHEARGDLESPVRRGRRGFGYPATSSAPGFSRAWSRSALWLRPTRAVFNRRPAHLYRRRTANLTVKAPELKEFGRTIVLSCFVLAMIRAGSRLRSANCRVKGNSWPYSIQSNSVRRQESGDTSSRGFALAILLAGSVWWLLRYHTGKSPSFHMNAVIAGNLEQAYQRSKPSQSYSFNDFVEDWGANGYYGPVKASASRRDLEHRTGGSGVVIKIEVSPYDPFPQDDDQVKQAKTKEVSLWVEFKDQSTSLPSSDLGDYSFRPPTQQYHRGPPVF